MLKHKKIETTRERATWRRLKPSKAATAWCALFGVWGEKKMMCIATRSKGLTSSNKKLLVTSASLLVTSALLVVTLG